MEACGCGSRSPRTCISAKRNQVQNDDKFGNSSKHPWYHGSFRNTHSTFHADPEPATSLHDGPACAHNFCGSSGIGQASAAPIGEHATLSPAARVYNVSELGAPKWPYSSTFSNGSHDSISSSQLTAHTVYVAMQHSATFSTQRALRACGSLTYELDMPSRAEAFPLSSSERLRQDAEKSGDDSQSTISVHL